MRGRFHHCSARFGKLLDNAASRGAAAGARCEQSLDFIPTEDTITVSLESTPHTEEQIGRKSTECHGRFQRRRAATARRVTLSRTYLR